jgi:uncharacterized membrane protein YeaQ/YmgE (transglycosylase-associated protein family)
MVLLGIVEWIVVGLVIGFVCSKLVDLHGDDPRLGIFVAAGGAIVAAALYCLILGTRVSGWSPMTLACAAVGSVTGALVWHSVRSRYVSRDRYTTRSSY